MKRPVLPSVLATAPGGCAAPQPGGPVPAPPAEPATEVAPAVATAAPGAGSATAAARDTTTREEKAAALAAPTAAGKRELGRAVIALGPPVETGLWLSLPPGQGGGAGAGGDRLWPEPDAGAATGDGGGTSFAGGLPGLETTADGPAGGDGLRAVTPPIRSGAGRLPSGQRASDEGRGLQEKRGRAGRRVSTSRAPTRPRPSG